MTRSRPEQALGMAVADYLSLALPPEVLWTAVGHGGGGKIRGAILKRMGLLSGVPDLVIFYNDEFGVYRVLWIELKSSTGRQSPEQRDFAARAIILRHFYSLCRSVSDVEAALKKFHVPMRKVKVSA